MNPMKIQSDQNDTFDGTRLQLVEWSECAPFAVEVNGRFGLANQTNLERNHYAKLDIGIPYHRPPGSPAWLRRNRRNSRVDRSSTLSDFSGVVRDVVDLRTQEGLTNPKQNQRETMKTKQTLVLMTALAMVITCTPLRAARNDDARIVSAAKQSYVYRTYLKNDDIKIQADD